MQTSWDRPVNRPPEDEVNAEQMELEVVTEALPEGWIEVLTSDGGYFWNRETDEVQFHRSIKLLTVSYIINTIQTTWERSALFSSEPLAILNADSPTVSDVAQPSTLVPLTSLNPNTDLPAVSDIAQPNADLTAVSGMAQPSSPELLTPAEVFGHSDKLNDPGYGGLESVAAIKELAPENSLLPGWAEVFDANGDPYYWHEKTNEVIYVRVTALFAF